MNIEFNDITYTVNKGWKEKGEGRTILHGVSGCFRTGELTAIMGPSGAGKSTLLNILSGYKRHNGKGTMTVNAKPLNRHMFSKSCRYIAQEDIPPRFFTTGEAMNIAASLKLPSSMSEKEREDIVHDKLTLLGLDGAFNTPTERLSGGQQKRLAIALELINEPRVFFLDEPTSGLDDVTTKQIVKLLRDLAKGGRNIVCTIHQPSASIFQLFDSVYVLGRGRCVYQGCVKNLLPFLSSAGFKCPTYHNPADFVIEVADQSDINVSVLSKAMENGKISHTPSKEQINQLDYDFNAQTEIDRRISRQSSSDGSDGAFQEGEDEYKSLGPITDSISYVTSGWHQFKVLHARMATQHYRNRIRHWLMFMHHITCGLLIGACFTESAKDAENMFTNIKFITCYIFFHAYTHIMQPVLVFPNEVKLLKKEHFNRWYGLKAFYAAYVLNQMPMMLVFGAIFNIIIYLFIGMPLVWDRFLWFMVIGLLTGLTADAFGMAMGSSLSSLQGAAIAPIVLSPFILFSFYALDFPHDLSWPTNILIRFSFMRVGVNACLIAMFGLNREKLECHLPYCTFHDPKDVMKFVAMEDRSIWVEIFSLLAIMFICRVTCYVGLRIRLSRS